MNLSELTTPYERRKVICHATNSNKAVQHYMSVRCICDTLYMTEPSQSDHGGWQYQFCIFFPNIPAGMVFDNCYRDPSEVPIVNFPEQLRKLRLDSATHFIQELDERVKTGIFISNVQIAMSSQIAPDRTPVYEKARADFYARKEQEDTARRLAQQQEDAVRKAQKDAERLAWATAEKAKLHGWADGMSPMQLGRVMKILEKRIRVDGKVMAKYEFVAGAVANGYIPKKVEGATSWYGSRWEPKESKARTEYRLTNDSGSYVINKTEYDYAVYLYEKKSA